MSKDYKTKLERYRKIISIIFVVLLFAQFFIYNDLRHVNKDLFEKAESLNKLKVEAETVFIKDTVRGQQRTMLNAIRQGWVQYLQVNPQTQLLEKDSSGRYIYSNSNGQVIVFDDNTMTKIKNPDKFYTIKDKTTGKVVGEKMRLQWNRETVKNVLNIVASPVRAFGSTGDVIIFDSYTGEMITDNSEDCKDAPQVLGKDGRRYITLDDKHPNNQNPVAAANVIKNQMMWRSDTDATSGMVYFFSESKDMGKNANDFSKYPLGQYKREFQEKIILPYETVGVEGQDMQITVILGSQEQEITSPYSRISKEYNELESFMKNQIDGIILEPIISIAISLVVILLALFSIVITSHICKINNSEKKRDETKS